MADSDQYDQYDYGDRYDYEPAEDGTEGYDYYQDYKSNDNYGEYRAHEPFDDRSGVLGHNDALMNADQPDAKGHEHVDVLARALEVADALPPALPGIDPSPFSARITGLSSAKIALNALLLRSFSLPSSLLT